MTSTKLKEYLYTILSLENQIYTYQRAEEIYIKKIRKIEEDKNTVFLNDKEDYKRRKFHRSNQVVPAPDAKPNYIGEKKTRRGRKEFIYGFNGLNHMYRQIPERWMEGELGLLYKKEHNKFRNKHVLVWICACVLGILLSFLVSNILPLPIAVLIAIFLSYKIGNENQIEYTPGNEVYDTFMHIYTQNYNADLKVKEEMFAPQIRKLTEEYETYIKQNLLNTTRVLSELYDKNFIHPKYQNFIAISQLYDYINIGRCSELNGPDGAYNLYDLEKNNGLLVSELNISLFKLEKYESTMYTLVDLLRKNDKIISKIFTEINHDSNYTLKETVNLYQNQLSDISQHYPL